MPIEPPRAPCIALFAHPDDEFALFPWLTAAVRQGREVHCLYLTDGGWGGQHRARRRRESIAVLATLGIPAAHLAFLGERWNVPDGALHLHLSDVAPRLCAFLAPVAGGCRLLIPAWEGGHQDHDAAHLAGLALARMVRVASVRQFPLYHGDGLPGPFFKVLAPLGANGPAKAVRVDASERLRCVRRCFSYRSQWRSFIGLIPPYAIGMLRRNPFVLQPVSPARTAERPHPGTPFYARHGGPTWEAFAAATEAWRHPFARPQRD